MNRQNIIITMAGRGTRFRDAGYQAPKYEIEAHGSSLFEWSLRSLTNFQKEGNKWIFVCLAENRSVPFVKDRCERHGLGDVEVVEVKNVTDGQATTAYVARDVWEPAWPLMIYNIDTYVDARALRPSDIRPGSDGWVPCFRAPGDHWSFVEVGDDGWAARVTEKERISDLASIGLYWFSRAVEFGGAYEEYYAGETCGGKRERYIAPMYNHLIARGKKVSVVDIPASDVHVLGTPKELEEFVKLGRAEIG